MRRLRLSTAAVLTLCWLCAVVGLIVPEPDPKQLERCFSIVAKERTLDLEAQSKAQRDAFMYGIHKVLTNQGFGITETDKGEEARQAHIEELKRNMLPVRNTFEISTKLRNLPILPWADDETNNTMVAVYEKQGATFVLIEQTDWQKDNAMPNFSKPLLMPFTVPLVPSIVKIVIYDHACDDSHIVGSALVRTDTFQRYVGQEMLIKLRNHQDAAIDTQLTESNTYMLLTAVIKQGDARALGTGSGDPNAKAAFNSVLGQLKGEIGGGGGGRGGSGPGGGYKSSFIKSITTFMGAGESFVLYPVSPSATVPAPLAALKTPTAITIFYRPDKGSEHGQLLFVESRGKSDDELLDEQGMPRTTLLALPVTQLKETISGVQPPHFKGVPATVKADRCMSVLVKKSGSDETLLFTLDLEARNKNVRDAWASGMTDFIAFVEEDGGDDEKLKFLEEKKGKLSAIDAAKKNKLQGDSNIVGEMGDKFEGGSGSGGNKLTKGKWADDSDDDDDSKAKEKAKKKTTDELPKPVVELDAPVLGEGDIPPPPPMFDVVFGADGIPLAPPPPGAPSFTVAPVWKGPKLKRLHWEALDGVNVDGTLWGLVQGDLEAEAGAMLEEMFKIADAKKKPEGEEEAKEKVKRLYDGKRAQNIEILIKSFRMPVPAIQEAILTMDMSILTQERLQILLTCCPTIEEATTLRAYRKKNPELDSVGQAEMFGYALLDIPKVTMRLRLLLFQTKFDGLVKDMIDTYSVLLTGAEKIKESERLKKVMGVVLSVGNYLNQSTRKKAVGFRLQALEKLNDTRSTDNKETLLDFIIAYMAKVREKDEAEQTGEGEEKMEAEQKEEKKGPVGEKEPPPSYLIDLIAPVHQASLIDWKALNEERENLLTGLSELDKELQSMSKDEDSEHDQFRAVMEEFLQHANRRVGKLKKKYNEVNDETTALVEYFGESSKTMETTELFKIFDRFFNMYKTAEVNGFNRREQEAKKERLAKAREEAQRLKEEKAQQSGRGDEKKEGGAVEGGVSSPFGATLRKRPSQSDSEKKGDTVSAAPTEASNPFGVTLKKRPSATGADALPASSSQQQQQQQVVADAINGKSRYVPPAGAPVTLGQVAAAQETSEEEPGHTAPGGPC